MREGITKVLPQGPLRVELIGLVPQSLRLAAPVLDHWQPFELRSAILVFHDRASRIRDVGQEQHMARLPARRAVDLTVSSSMEVEKRLGVSTKLLDGHRL